MVRNPTAAATSGYAADLVRVLRLFHRARVDHTWVVVAITGLLATAVVEGVAGTGAGGFAVAACGALAGVILLPMATQLGLLAGSWLFGLRVRHVVLGAMRRVRSWELGRVTLTLRALPVVLSSEIGPWKRPVVLRCWLAGLVSALTGLSLVAAAWLTADGSFGRGLVLAVTPLMLHKLRPKRAPMSTSTGWLLFGLPRMTESARAEFRAGSSAARAREALQRGDLDGAEHLVETLESDHPGLDTTISCRVSLMEAHGDYAHAVALLLHHLSSAELAPREMSYTLAGLAGLGFSAVEADQVPARELLPTARKALDDAVTLGFPDFELSGTRGQLALLEQDTDSALRLASTGAERGTSPLSRADDLATLARAHMARHDNTAAREALARAEELADWWPRVRRTRERLSVLD